MKIYVAGSWRNKEAVQAVADRLAGAGHRVYDFTRPPSGVGFSWAEVGPGWTSWTPQQHVDALDHPAARAGFFRDLLYLQSADAVVLVAPCGKSAHLELGYGVGADKYTAVLLAAEPQEGELMYAMVSRVTDSLDTILADMAIKEGVWAC